MEEKNNTGLKVLVVILIILVLGLSFYIVYDKVLSNNREENNNVDDPVNQEKISNDKDVNDKELINFIDTLSFDGGHGDLEAKYKKITVKVILPPEISGSKFGGIKIYYDNEEIFELEGFDIYTYGGNEKAVYFNENDGVFFMTFIGWGAHGVNLLAIDLEGNIIFNEQWNEGSININPDNWEITVSYMDFCCGGRIEDIVKAENKKKEDIVSGTIVYQYSDKKMNVIKHDYKTYGEEIPEAFK